MASNAGPTPGSRFAWPISKQNRKSRRCVSFTNCRKRFRRAKFARGIFQRDSDAARLRENGEKLERREGGVQLARVERIAAVAHVLHEIAEGNALGDFEGALHFVHRIEAANALGVRNRDGGAAVAALGEIALGGRMKRMQFDAVAGKAIGKFANGLRRAINEMRGRAEDLDAGNSCAGDLRKQCVS